MRTDIVPVYLTSHKTRQTHLNLGSQHIPFSLEISCSFSCCSSKYLCLWSLNVLLNSSPCFRWSSSRLACCFFSSSCWLCKYQVGHLNSSVLAYLANIDFGSLLNKSKWTRSIHNRKFITQSSGSSQTQNDLCDEQPPFLGLRHLTQQLHCPTGSCWMCLRNSLDAKLCKVW